MFFGLIILSQRTTIRRATNEDSDQPAHPRSLIRVFADRMCLPQCPRYPKSYKLEPLPYWVDIQADLSLCWSHVLLYSKTCVRKPPKWLMWKGGCLIKVHVHIM